MTNLNNQEQVSKIILQCFITKVESALIQTISQQQFDKKSAMQKVKIAYAYRGDMSILQQQLESAVKQTMEELEQQEQDDPDFKQLKPIIERRLQQFFMNVSSKFRSMVQYSKTHEKDVQKIVMQPDENLQKINEVKTSMLRQSLLKSQRQQWPQINHTISVQEPENLTIVNLEGKRQNIKECLARNYQKIPSLTQEIEKVQKLEQVIIESVQRLEAQQKIDSELIDQK